jgi:hypothetical protein
MSVFHKSMYGMFGETFEADLDGYVADTPSEVMNDLNWSETPTEEQAEEIALNNRARTKLAANILAVWLERKS